MSDLDTLLQYSQDITVLYVEDDIDVQEATLAILEDFFTNIITANNGIEGFVKFQNHPIDLIITDINMPRLDGLSMIQKIKEFHPYIPTLIFSAYNDQEHFIKAIKVGVDGYLLKPLELDQFQQSLLKALRTIKLQKENKAYQTQLEEKVQQQLEAAMMKDKILLEQSKHAAMGEMIDIIAHQWKQPLNSLVMHTSLMEDTLETTSIDELKKEFQAYQKNFNQQIDTLMTTLNEFRSFFRPNASLKPIALDRLVDSTLLLLKDELLSHQIEVIVACDPTIEVTVHPNDIKQLLMNIIHNAKEEMIHNNPTLTHRKITIKCYKEWNEIILLIKDNAKGIDPQVIQNIFDMNVTTKAKDGGTGIGLYMCRLICEKYNATIEAYNDNGAVFKIVF